MCQQMEVNTNKSVKTHLQPIYSIKKVLKVLFKNKQQKVITHAQRSNSLESLESLDNLRNDEMEHFYEEIGENCANEKLANMMAEDLQAEEDVYVPVRFARTEAGTFFWTTNLQPVTTFAPVADEDLLQPTFCYSSYQYPKLPFQDRWAQA